MSHTGGIASGRRIRFAPRDDLQVIRLLREQDLGIEMQFTNYRSE